MVHVENKFLAKDLSVAHATPGIFVGYCDKSPSYLFYMPKTRTVVSRRDAVFFENCPGIEVMNKQLHHANPKDIDVSPQDI